ncbi:hypothetical protein [Salipiger sp.]|uniref:hypothetical protein n=1 Tax=Salipiger sp. TaxID=2078585 RepID=UPI003A97E27E
MAYEHSNPRYNNPYASNLSADPELRAPAAGAGSTMAGLLVAVLVVLGLIIGVSFFTSGEATDTQVPAATTTVPADGGAAAPAAPEAAPAPAPAPAE